MGEMRFENPLRLVRELKGAALSIVNILIFCNTRVSNRYLSVMADYTDKTIADALMYLEQIGLVNHTSAGWQLSRDGRQAMLPVAQAFALEEGEGASEVEAAGEVVEAAVDDESRNNSESVRTYLINNPELDSESSTYVPESKNSDLQMPDQGVLPGLPAGSGENGVGAGGEVAAELARAGIRLTRRVKDILKRPYVTSDYVRYQRERLEGEGKRFPEDAALLIRVIDDGDTGRPAHPKNCNCVECRRVKQSRYADWESG